jgi:parallel beta-helix repeat protein
MGSRISLNIVIVLVIGIYLLGIMQQEYPEISTSNKIRTEQSNQITKPIYASGETITILSDDDFVSLGFPGNGTAENPYLIDNLTIELNNMNATCIHIRGTKAAFIVRNCRLSGCGWGINLNNVSNAVIENNSIQDCNYALFLTDVNDSTLANNTCSAIEEGIRISEWCNNINIFNNLVRNCTIGIYLNSFRTHMIGNRIVENTLGMEVHAFNATYMWNSFQNNTYSIMHYDYSLNQHFYEYNYWSDYEGTDSDYDGVGDSWYNIPNDDEDIRIFDPHPLMAPFYEYAEDILPPTIKLYEFQSEYEIDETIAIKAEFIDWSGIKGAILSYSYDNVSWHNKTMRRNYILTSNPDFNWTQSIPPSQEETTVNFRIYVNDNADNWKISEVYSYRALYDVYGPSIIWGDEWEYFFHSLACITAGCEGLDKMLFDVTITDKSRVDTILFYYWVSSYRSPDSVPNEVLEPDSYNSHSGKCVVTLQIDPPMIDCFLKVYFWANDTLGHSTISKTVYLFWDGFTPPQIPFANQSIILIMIIVLGSLIVVVIVLKRWKQKS